MSDEDLSEADSEALDSIWDMLVKGDSDKEIMELMGLDSPVYRALKKKLLETKAGELKGKAPEHVYVEYILAQTRGIQDIDAMIKDFKTSKNWGAMVAAVRVRAELYDKLIAKGQEFGVFRKAPERKELVGGILLADLTNADLRKQIVGAVSSLEKLMKRYGDVPLDAVSEGEIYSGPKLTDGTKAEEVLETTAEDVEVPMAKDDVPPPPPRRLHKPERARTAKHSSAARGRRSFELGSPKKVKRQDEIGPDVWDD